jgi:hypothetical protein
MSETTKFKPVNVSLDVDTIGMCQILSEIEAQSRSSIIRLAIRRAYFAALAEMQASDVCHEASKKRAERYRRHMVCKKQEKERRKESKSTFCHLRKERRFESLERAIK